MKQLLFTAVIFGAASSAFSAPIFCTHATEGNTYTVTINSRWTKAKVKLNGELLNFGELACSPPESRSEAILYCHSTGVADAGYSARLILNRRHKLALEIEEISIIGAKSIATLSCTKAHN